MASTLMPMRSKLELERDAGTLDSIDKKLDKIEEELNRVRQNVHALRTRLLPDDDPRVAKSRRSAIQRQEKKSR